MTQIPKDELWTMPPPEWFAGKRVLELGNKKNQSGLYRDWYVSNGAEYLCLDWNGEDGAIVADMGVHHHAEKNIRPLIGWADIVTNFGFTEHVFTDQRQCWENVLALAAKPGCMLSIVQPYPTHWDHHGVFQPTPGWLMSLVRANGFEMFLATVNEDRKRWVTCIGAQRVEPFDPATFVYPDPHYQPVTPHTCPMGKGIYITPPGKRVNAAEKNCGVSSV